jgi:hypothetical protein
MAERLADTPNPKENAMPRTCPYCASSELDTVGYSEIELTSTSAFHVGVDGNLCRACGEIDEHSFTQTSIREDRPLYESYRATGELQAA